MRIPRKILGNSVFTLLLLLFYITSYLALGGSQNRIARQVKNIGIWDLPPSILSILAGEFKGLVADYLTLEAENLLGSELESTTKGAGRLISLKVDCPTVYKIFQASQRLDPSFQQTFMVAQGWLPWECNMVQETTQILHVAADNRPWDWQPEQFMAFNSYYFMNNYAEAGKIFLEAAQKRKAPSYLAILGARLAQKGGETGAAIALMKNMLSHKSDSEPGYNDMVERLHALQGTLIIENGVKAYKKRFGTFPALPEDLLKVKLIREIPPNPYNLPYCIDLGGKVYFDRPNCREADK